MRPNEPGAMSTLVEPPTRIRTPEEVEPIATPTRAPAALAAGLIAIGLGLATVAFLGPLLTGVIDYHVTETLRNQTIGLDAVSLLVVAPLSVIAALLVLRGHAGGPALALGIGAYTSYMLVQYILGPEYERLPGNNELLFPLYLVLFTLGWVVALAAWNRIGTAPLPRSRRRDRLVGTLALPLLALLAFFRYLPALIDWMSASPEDSGYLAGPTFAWAIAMLDLGIFLPATIAACAGLVRGTPWAHKALYIVVGWFGLVGPAVAAMAITMYVNHDANGSGGNVVFMTALGLAFAVFALILFKPLFQADAHTESRARTPRARARRVHYTGVGLALGCGAGAAIGVLFGTTGLLIGAGVGNALGLLTGAVIDWRLAPATTETSKHRRSDLS